MKRQGFFLAFLLIASWIHGASRLAFGQQVEPARTIETAPKPAFVPHYYHLSFVVKELEGGKVINSREYNTSVGIPENDGQNYQNRSIRTGAKIPMGTQYVDTGISIDFRSIRDLGGRIGMNVSAEINSVPSDMLSATQPTILQNKWNSDVVVSLGKPTTIFSSDETNSKRTMQLELTATEIK